MDGGDDALIKFQHKDDHVPYWNIDVPLDIQNFVRKNVDLGPAQVHAIVFMLY